MPQPGERYNVCPRWCRDTRTVTRVRHHHLVKGRPKSAQQSRDSTVAARRAHSVTVPSSRVSRECRSPGLRSPPPKKMPEKRFRRALLQNPKIYVVFWGGFGSQGQNDSKVTQKRLKESFLSHFRVILVTLLSHF